uniref:Uncharacterized protein n=1 Tax=Timema poppense TaxID=170557 RepID=A0A7R9DMQ4_TIMPO|nr:unnamed protein product [Timema poppensis]
MDAFVTQNRKQLAHTEEKKSVGVSVSEPDVNLTVSEVIPKGDGVCVVSEVTLKEVNCTSDITSGNNLKSEWPEILTAAVWDEKEKTFYGLYHDNFRSIEIARTESFQGMKFDRLNEIEVEATNKVYRSAYVIAKDDRPYYDHAELSQLQQLNGAVISPCVQSRFKVANIIDHSLQTYNGKVSVIIDESTTLSTRTTSIVYLKCEKDKSTDTHFIFLDLIELPNITTKFSTDNLLICLSTTNLVSFKCDCAVAMPGRKSGVGQRPQ